jgi:hypothetical protein
MEVSTNKRVVSTTLLHVIFPLVIGGIIYILFRSLTLRLFYWIEMCGLKSTVLSFRNLIYQDKVEVPSWIFYSLPDGLWVYSFTSALIIFWKNEKTKLIFWLVIPFTTGILFEILQGFNCFPGTFDVIDLILSIIAFYSSIKILKIKYVKIEKSY